MAAVKVIVTEARLTTRPAGFVPKLIANAIAKTEPSRQLHSAISSPGGVAVAVGAAGALVVPLLGASPFSAGAALGRVVIGQADAAR